MKEWKTYGELIETKFLTCILKEAINDYRQGISDSEIKKRIEKKKLELGVISSSTEIISQGIKEPSL